MGYYLIMKQSILLVDDESDNLDALERLFRKKFEVLKALGGKEALGLLDDHSPAVIISDQRMPEMSGVDFLKKSINTHPDAIRILLTGYTDIESVISAINSGQIYKYVTKPWDPVDLLNTVEKACEKYELRSELKLKNQQLEEAYEELKSLDESKTSFMLLINHELKTPLTVLSSYLQLLNETKLDKDQKNCVEKLNSAYERLELLISDSLRLLEAETQQLKVKTSTINLADFTEQTLSPFESSFTEKNLKLVLNYEVDKVKTDSNLLADVFSRLIDNACRFSDKDTDVNITVDKYGKQAKFTIASTGKKIDSKKIDSLLKPFTLDEKALNHSKGTGLGLAICNSQLKLLDSELQIKADGKKTIISFDL